MSNNFDKELEAISAAEAKEEAEKIRLETLLKEQRKKVKALADKRAEAESMKSMSDKSRMYDLMVAYLSGIKHSSGENMLAFVNRASGIDKEFPSVKAETDSVKEAQKETKKVSDSKPKTESSSSSDATKKEAKKEEPVSTSTPETKNNSGAKEQAESSNSEKKVETKGSQAEKSKAFAGVPF